MCQLVHDHAIPKGRVIMHLAKSRPLRGRDLPTWTSKQAAIQLYYSRNTSVLRFALRCNTLAIHLQYKRNTSAIHYGKTDC